MAGAINEAEMSLAAGRNVCPDWVEPPIAPVKNWKKYPQACGWDVVPKKVGLPTLVMPPDAKVIYDNLPFPFDRLFFLLVFTVLTLIGAIMTAFARFTGCKDMAITAPAAQRFIWGFLGRWLGFEIRPVTAQIDQQINTACSREIMSAPEANTAFLTDSLKYDKWQCIQAANGYLSDQQAPLVWSSRMRPDPREVLTLYNRGEISEEEYNTRLRGLGFISADDAERWFTAQTWLPPVTDIIRMMVRDVADPAIVNRYGLDDEFEDKFQGRLLRYAQSENIPDYVMRDEWRMHWQTPSYTQSCEMLHRYDPETHPDVDPELATTREDVELLLGQNDMLPFWRKRMMGISYRPMTRTDIQRAYFIDRANEKDVFYTYLAEGLDKTNAQIMTDFTKGLKAQFDRSHAGRPTLYAVAEGYANGYYGLDEAWRRAQRDSVTRDVFDQAIDASKERYHDRRVQKMIAAIRSRYRKGGYSDDAAVDELMALDMDANQAHGFVREWRDLKWKRDRQPTLSALCEWAQRNWIGAKEYVERLQNLGFSAGDARLIAADCGLDGAMKAAKEAEKEAKKRLADYQKAVKAYQQALKAWMDAGGEGDPPAPPTCQAPPQSGSVTGVPCVTDPCTGKVVKADQLQSCAPGDDTEGDCPQPSTEGEPNDNHGGGSTDGGDAGGGTGNLVGSAGGGSGGGQIPPFTP